jgi:hypothetical protein
MNVTAYPLHWPQGFPRTRLREKGTFRATLPAALAHVNESLRLFAADSGKKLENVVMSSNVTLGQARPADPGVAVWFTWDDLGLCIPIDRYMTVEANLQAVHHILEARRVEIRHGSLALVRASFAGFLALPAPTAPGPRPWWEVLGVASDAPPDVVTLAFRKERSKAYPRDGGGGGDPQRFAELNEAYRQATATQ